MLNPPSGKYSTVTMGIASIFLLHSRKPQYGEQVDLANEQPLETLGVYLTCMSVSDVSKV